MPVVTVQPEGVKITVPYEHNLLTTLLEVGINIESVCGGHGICKKCLIEVIGGSLSDPTSAEAEVTGGSKTVRLSCQAKVLKDVTINVPQLSRQIRGKILEWGQISFLELSPSVRCVDVELDKPSLSDQRSDVERLFQSVNIRLIDGLLLRRLPGRLRELEWKLNVILYDDEILDVRPRFDRDIYGVAVDIGTTTIVVYLVNLKTGRVISVKSDYNGQIAYGDDVISRMSYAMKDYRNLKDLQEKVVATINRLVREAVSEVGCSPSDIYEASFAGNTVMINLLYGSEVSAVALAPYVPPFRHSLLFKAAEIGLELNSSAKAYIFPLVSGYVGGDVVADILVSEMHRKDENSLLIDLGTNGEVVVKSGDVMLAASTAAGPALEGAGLSNGMRGMEGAIESVSIDVKNYEVYYKTIGGVEPRGLCGSGVVDSIAWMLVSGIIDQKGRISDLNISRVVKLNGEKVFVLAVNNKGKEIYVSQSDVRRFQLAKAAIFSACSLLLKTAGLKTQELSRVYIAGAFGNYVDPRSAMIVGMIPEIPLNKIFQIGNGSGYGAVMSLLSKKGKEEAELVAKRVRAIDLNSIREFQKEFIDATQFPHGRTDLFIKVVNAIRRRAYFLD